MPTIAGRRSSPITGEKQLAADLIVDLTPKKRTLRSNSTTRVTPITSTLSSIQISPVKRKTPRRCVNDSPSSPAKRVEENTEKMVKASKSPVKKRLLDSFIDKPIWNPRDSEQLSTVKEALHVSTAPSSVVCRELEQNRILEFCKQCVEQDKASSLYVCGCPGTGKSLSMEKVKEGLVNWANEAGFQAPDVLSISCTSLSNTSEIFSKILGENQTQKKGKGNVLTPLQQLQNLYSQKQQSSGMKMKLIIADELDYLITRDRAVLHDLFMLTTLPFSRCILLGVANAIDLADKFLPKLKSLNCKPMVITFRAYSKDQIIKILQQRIMGLPYKVFQPQALELCARKVSAASGDMRKALWVCRSAIEMLEAEIKECNNDLSLPFGEEPQNIIAKQENYIVRVDHVGIALSKAYKSPVVDIIKSLPQHQQFILCSAVKLFRGGKKDSTVGELNKCYTDVCKSTSIPPVGISELCSMCKVLADQGLIKLGGSKDDKLKRVTLKIDEADVSFALQGIRFFRNCLQ